MTAIPETATGLVTIDLGAIAGNWRALASLVAPAECAAVVKADAYGLGASRVIPALAKAGCRTFFVATLDEAAEARGLAQGARIFVLDGLFPGCAGRLATLDAIPVLASLEDAAEWSEFSHQKGRRLPAALNLGTGLNRLGLRLQDVKSLMASHETISMFDVELVMSHLASADDPSDPKNEEQRVAFERHRAHLPPAPASLAASDGLMLGPRFHYDLVRPGYALYGGQAFRGGPAPVKPAVQISARILQVRDVAAGETVGYSATWTATRPTRIAVVAAGYADGYGRGASAATGQHGGMVQIRDQLARVVGRVSMDLITVDVTDVPGGVARGDAVQLVGPGLTLETAGARAGTIGYEVLTRIGRRFHRTYVGGG